MTAAHIQLEIDCLATARRILSSPTAVYAATPFEIIAMAACTIRESAGSAPALPVIGDRPAELPASLAARLQIAIDRWQRLAKAEAAYSRSAVNSAPEFEADQQAWSDAKDAFEDAFNILTDRFEKEFPVGNDH